MKKQEIYSLTALRGVAALLVVVHHYGLISMPWRHSIVSPMLQKFGLLGMTLFFVLSGFVIGYNYSDKIDSRHPKGLVDFIIARIARLMPLYLLFVTANYIYNIYVVAPQNIKNLSLAFPFNFFAIQSWFFAKIGNLELVSSQIYANISWSISTEMMLYLILVMFGFIYFRYQKSFLRGLTLVLGSIIFRALVVKYSDSLEPELSHWFVYYSPWGRWFEFMSGVGLAEMWVCRESRHDRFMWIYKYLGLISLMFIVISFGDSIFYNFHSLFSAEIIYISYAITVPFFIFWACMQHEDFFKMPFSSTFLFIGELSYSIYLLHGNLFPLPFFSASEADSAFKMVLKTIVFFPSLLFLSYLSFKFIELPAKRYVWHFYMKRVVIVNKSCKSTGESN